MTRYARAKGSKASNERIPEPATPWSEMKQQLLEKKKEEDSKEKREEINAQRLDSYKKFLNEHEAKESKKTKWAEFPGVKKPQKESKLKKKKTIEKLREGADAVVNGSADTVVNGNDGTNKVGKKKKNKELDRIVDEEFNKLKLKLDKILDEDKLHNNTQDSDNDRPEELSSKVELPEIKIKKAKQKKKLKILSNSVKEVNEKCLDGDCKNNSNEASDQQIEKEIAESEINQEKKKKKMKRPVLEEKSVTQVEEGPIKKKSKKFSENNQTSENGELEKGLMKKKSKATLGKQENKLPFSEGSKKNTNIDQNAEISMKKLARKERKKKKQWEKRQLKKAQKQAEKESQNTDVISGKVKKFSNQQTSLENQKQSNGHTNKISMNGNEINNSKNKPKFTMNQNRSYNNISKPVSKENKTKMRLDGADGENVPKKKKIKDERTRRKPLGPETMTINGQNVAIEFVDGFPVKKEDAVRLKQLRKQMISKGLPRSEINKALKLERRKAEKALARLKRVVCFNCRKTGHNLSECPEVGKDELAQSMAVDICFKCGSTEHKSYECKVVRGDNFKHATCFICKEQGHISRQCPDNPRGLYPKGGACKVCGDVTHLKKDCPEYQAHQQQQGGVKVDVINDSNLEDLGEGNDKTLVKKRVNKVIKF